MDLVEIGSWGYRAGSLGIVAFTAAFLVSVRWWSDLLGRVLAFVFTVMSSVLITSAYRTFNQEETQAFLVWRAILYWSFAIGIWLGIATFIWAQFLAPRLKSRTTRREKQHAEADLAADGPDPDGDRYDRAGGHR